MELCDEVVSQVTCWLRRHPEWQELQSTADDVRFTYLDRAFAEIYSDEQMHYLLRRHPGVLGWLPPLSSRSTQSYGNQLRRALRLMAEPRLIRWMDEQQCQQVTA